MVWHFSLFRNFGYRIISKKIRKETVSHRQHQNAVTEVSPLGKVSSVRAGDVSCSLLNPLLPPRSLWQTYAL